MIYPREHRFLYEDIAARGVILSEYPPGTEHMAGHFPVRNRIISGLSLGVVVIEAPERSGALITAGRALDQGKDVFAIPGQVGDHHCAGSNAPDCFASGGTPPAPVIPEAIFCIKGIVCVSGTVAVLDLSIIPGTLVFISYDHGDGRPGSFSFKGSGKDFCKVVFTALCRKLILSRLSSV